MTATTKNAPSMSGNSAEGNDRNHRKEPIMNDATSVPLTTDTLRYVVIGTDVFDREADRIARFQNAGVAQIGADWLNSPDATPEDYEWTSAEDMTSDEWVAVHPEVTAAAPAWVNKVTAEEDGPRVALRYDLKFDALEIGTAAPWSHGAVDFHGDNRAYLYFQYNEKPVTADDLRAFAADFAAAADALEAASRTVRRSPEVDDHLRELDD
jgi:hypothetical protein